MAISRTLRRPGRQRADKPDPVDIQVGSRVRLRLAVHGLTDAAQAVRATLLQTFERDGTTKPVCIATSILHLGTA